VRVVIMYFVSFARYGRSRPTRQNYVAAGAVEKEPMATPSCFSIW
jgi:hypothetical protein